MNYNWDGGQKVSDEEQKVAQTPATARAEHCLQVHAQGMGAVHPGDGEQLQGQDDQKGHVVQEPAGQLVAVLSSLK